MISICLHNRDIECVGTRIVYDLLIRHERKFCSSFQFSVLFIDNLLAEVIDIGSGTDCVYVN